MRVNGLFGWVRHNRARSLLLLGAFVLIIQLLAALTLFAPLVYLDRAHAPYYHWLGYGSRYVPVVAAIAIALFAWQMWRHVGTVQRQAGFRFVNNADEPRLCGLVEPLAIAAGLRAPYVAVIESPAMNAFACGRSPRDAVVVVTRGLIDGLDDDELAGVVAHELIHIRGGDIRLMAVANAFMNSLGALHRLNIVRIRGYRQIVLLLFVPMLFPLFLVVGLLGRLGLRLGAASRLVVASSREFIADAQGLDLTQNPSALISALRRIDGNSLVPGLPAQLDAMMIDGATTGAIATHPTVAERIGAIASLVGPLALGPATRGDTRPAAERARFGRRGLGAAEEAELEQLAASMAGARALGWSSLLRVGDGGAATILGLRWDLAVALLATFGAGLALHRGDMGGYLTGMTRFYGQPDADQMWFVENAAKCSAAERATLTGGTKNPAACQITPEFVRRARAQGQHVLADGRILSDAQFAMISPEERGPPAVPGRPPFLSGARGTNDTAREPDTDLPPAVALPVDQAYRRLLHGSLSRYLAPEQCGILIHAQVEGVPNRSVTWRILSEGEERVRFTVLLAAQSPGRTGLTLRIEDLQPSEEPAPAELIHRPALPTPLRPAFAEAASAMLDQRPFDADRVHGEPSASESVVRDMCFAQHGRLAEGEHISIHDPANAL